MSTSATKGVKGSGSAVHRCVKDCRQSAPNVYITRKHVRSHTVLRIALHPLNHCTAEMTCRLQHCCTGRSICRLYWRFDLRKLSKPKVRVCIVNLQSGVLTPFVFSWTPWLHALVSVPLFFKQVLEREHVARVLKEDDGHAAGVCRLHLVTSVQLQCLSMHISALIK